MLPVPDLALFAVLAFALSFGVSLLIWVSRSWHGRFTFDVPTGIQKFHRTPTPRIGGVAIALSFMVLLLCLPGELGLYWGLAGLASLPALIAGLWEDITRAVSTRTRLAATMVSGGLFAVLSGYTMDQVDLIGMDYLLGFYPVAFLFTCFAMGGVANAINIIDGLNGLAAGALLIMFATFAGVGALVGDMLVRDLAILFFALTLGFFVVNFPTGPIFLGDGGAYFAGFLLAVLGVLLPVRNAEISAWCAVLICAYPVIETLASMWRKSRRDGHSVGRPDGVHFHMLVYRRYGRLLQPRAGDTGWRNPMASVVTLGLPLLSSLLVFLSYRSTLLSAMAFLAMVIVYAELYKRMSLNSTPVWDTFVHLRRIRAFLRLLRRRKVVLSGAD